MPFLSEWRPAPPYIFRGGPPLRDALLWGKRSQFMGGDRLLPSRPPPCELGSLHLNKECQMWVVEFFQMTCSNKKYNTKPP